MDSNEFKQLRHKLKKTQKQVAQLLGTSLKAVHSYEQGWRPVPAYVERQMFFLISALKGKLGYKKLPCGSEENVSGLGVPDRQPLLVY
jgi:transcriptional regulator with XRE-family HTH domain